MIRKIESKETDSLIEGAKSFFAEGAIPGGFDAAHLSKSWRQLIESKVGVVFVSIGLTNHFEGALGAVLCPNLFNNGSLAVECFWYVMPEFRGSPLAIRLLHAFEAWAKEHSAKFVAMIHLENLHAEKLRKLYDRMGYKKVETHYVKEIK